jgi:primosomal protein N'
MCLPYLALNGVDLSVVTSLDAARSNPTWRADENIFRLLLELRELSNHEVMIQTRTTPDSVLNSAKQGSLEIFYNEEIQLRESLSYPPVVTFILLSWTGNKDIVTSTEEIIKTITQGHTADFYNNPNSTGEKILRHALFKIEKNNPAHEEFIGKLKKLPPYIRIEIDPNRIV